MKKLQLLLCLFVSTSFSQSLDKLDQLNGFDKFKFGSSTSSYNDLKRQDDNVYLKGVSHYKYEGDDPRTVAGIPVERISLFFYKNKLFHVLLAFGRTNRPFTETEYEKLRDHLIESFGSEYRNARSSKENGVLNGTIWNGENVKLECLRFDAVQNGYYLGGTISVFEKNLQQEQRNS